MTDGSEHKINVDMRFCYTGKKITNHYQMITSKCYTALDKAVKNIS